MELPATAGTGISVASSASSGLCKSGTGSVGDSASTSPRLGRCQTIVCRALAMRPACSAKTSRVCWFSRTFADVAVPSPSFAGSMLSRSESPRSTTWAQHSSGSLAE